MVTVCTQRNAIYTTTKLTTRICHNPHYEKYWISTGTYTHNCIVITIILFELINFHLHGNTLFPVENKRKDTACFLQTGNKKKTLHIHTLESWRHISDFNMELLNETSHFSTKISYRKTMIS